MNIVIACPGKKVETINAFCDEFSKINGKVIAVGNSYALPALYVANKAYIAPSIEDTEYIPALLNICKKEKASAILTLLDNDILVISKVADIFRNNGVMPIVVGYSVAQICHNKLEMYKFLVGNGFKCAKTYASLAEFKKAHKKGEINFPVFIKPISGDGSRGAMRCVNINELEMLVAISDKIIIQEFLDAPEIDIDAYVDMISGKMVSIFAKMNLFKKVGGQDKCVSYKDERLFRLVEKLIQELELVGPIDIEVFNIKGEYFVSEINPRFGARYMCAHGCGVNFINMIINNIKGIENNVNIGAYSKDILMLKYDKVMFKTKEQKINRI